MKRFTNLIRAFRSLFLHGENTRGGAYCWARRFRHTPHNALLRSTDKIISYKIRIVKIIENIIFELWPHGAQLPFLPKANQKIRSLLLKYSEECVKIILKK